MPSETPKNPQTPSIGRREFLRLVALGALGAIAGINPTEIAKAKEQQGYNIENERERLEAIKNLRIKYSLPLEEINPQIRFMLHTGYVVDFLSLPEVREALSNTNFQQTLLQIIKILSVESQESAKFANEHFDMQMDPEFRNLNRVRNQTERLIEIKKGFKEKEINYQIRDERDTLEQQQEYQIFANLWKQCFPNTRIPGLEEIEKLSKSLGWKIIDVGYKYLGEFKSKTNSGLDPNYPHFDLTNTPEPVEAWQGTGDFTCNLYASSFIACLGLQNRFSHRIDELQRPVIYKKDERSGKVGFYVEEGGRLVSPKGKVRELRAADQIDWISNKGVEEYGWIDVTDLGYDEKVKMLSEGYVFLGGNGEHNWIIIGLEINGKIEPVLTQSSDYVSMKLFLPKEQMANSRYLLGDCARDNKDGSNYTEPYIPFAKPYKLNPNIEECPEGTRIFAIKRK